MMNSYFFKLFIFFGLFGFIIASFLYFVDMLRLLLLKDLDLNEGEASLPLLLRSTLIGILFFGIFVSEFSLNSIVEKLKFSGNLLILRGALILLFFLYCGLI
jgi:hypothetical protein